MPRSSRTGNLEFDPEIEKTARRLTKETKLRKQQDSAASPSGIEHEIVFSDSSSESEEEEVQTPQIAMAAQRTLRELATPNVNQQPLCITYPTTEEEFELRSGLIHLLPTFRGIAGEDPHKHLKEFHVVCSTMKPQGVTEEHIKLRAFPFSLADKAKDWLFYLPSGSINTWEGLKSRFLEKFFPASRAANIRKEICGVRQATGETLYEYWERFKQLCASCPHHQIPDQLLIQYFYEGLLPMDRSMIDAASGGALVNKTPDEAKTLISTMAENSQQFGVRADGAMRRVNEVNHSDLEGKLSELTSLVRQMAVGQLQSVKTCGICAAPGHMTDMCPLLQEDTPEQANAVGGFSGPPPRRNDPFAPTYNPGWRNHPNFSYAPKPPGFQQPFQPRPPMQKPAPSNSNTSLEDLVKSLAQSTSQIQQESHRFQHSNFFPLRHFPPSSSSFPIGWLRSSPTIREVSSPLPLFFISPSYIEDNVEFWCGGEV